MYQFLKSKGLVTVAPEDAAELANSKKAVIVDVRPPKDYAKAHIQGSVSVPLFQDLDWSKGQILGKALKFVAYAANGVSPIEPNPDFRQQLTAASQNGQLAIITVCEAGGTMKPTVNFPEGKASRSLQAAYTALAEGLVPNVMHMERGLYGWYQADLPFEGEYRPEIGRTPSAAAEPTIKIMTSARGYEMRPEDK